jgi:protein phosphatase
VNGGSRKLCRAGTLPLPIEGRQRFVQAESLHHVHECVFGVLALESEPVDPPL